MRLSDEEFGALTLVSFQLLNERLIDQREHDYICAGIVASTVANVHRDSDKRPTPFSPVDFVPGYRTEEKPAEGLKPLSPEEQVAAFEALFNPPKFTKLVR
jgi:hypothetical protein